MRLIDADCLKEKGHFDDYDMFIVDYDDIDNAPTVDAVEVVRCKDCVHYCKCYVLGDSAENDEYYMVCDMGLGAIDDDWRVCDRVFPDDFCSRVERRKDVQIADNN